MIEISNFVSDKTRLQLNIGAITGMIFDACMNRSLQACRGTGTQVAGRDDSAASGLGTGFAVADGLLLTNHYVVDNCRGIRIGEQQQQADIVASDANPDLALLRADFAPDFQPTVRASAVVELGEPVLVAGYPLGDILGSLNITTGTISALSGPDGSGQLFQITAPVQPGNSGGPVLYETGQLMGVVVSRLNDAYALRASGALPQNINFAIQPDLVRTFLDRLGVPYRTETASSLVPNRRIAHYARYYTVPVLCRW